MLTEESKEQFKYLSIYSAIQLSMAFWRTIEPDKNFLMNRFSSKDCTTSSGSKWAIRLMYALFPKNSEVSTPNTWEFPKTHSTNLNSSGESMSTTRRNSNISKKLYKHRTIYWKTNKNKTLWFWWTWWTISKNKFFHKNQMI